MLESGEGLPEGVDFKGKFIYYVGPVDAVGDEAVGPAVQQPQLVWISLPT
ncbi:fumarate hydratase class I aerobic [Vibrio variabilis]|uniref:Fumarate hydratase class I aerobic n=1 Tax=Vibrio variabilis TaxID=990271 RepID=A0ABQ0JIS0_9VIBR|nr:fumarate hydratase class I aerobic [Vibrio variabilis]